MGRAGSRRLPEEEPERGVIITWSKMCTSAAKGKAVVFGSKEMGPVEVKCKRSICTKMDQSGKMIGIEEK